MKKIVAYIPIRGGSKGIPRKALKRMAGKPLFYYVIKAALLCNFFNEVYVAVDTEELKEAIKSEFCFSSLASKLKFFERQPEHCTDQAKQEPGLLDFAKKVDFDVVTLIQITNPFLKVDHLHGAFEKFIDGQESGTIDSLLSVVKVKGFIWQEKVGQDFFAINYDVTNRPNRQGRKNEDGFFIENGSFYITTKESLQKSENRLSGKIGYFEMPFYSIIEIDEPEDWPVVEGILNKLS